MRVPKDKILKGYPITPGRYVVLTLSELAALRPRTSTELEIAHFVRLNDIDPVFFDAAYYVHPDKGGEKGYALLYRAMADSGFVALGALAMHGGEHVEVIRPNISGLMLHTLFFASEVRQPEAAVDNKLVSDKELELAKMLVNAGTAPFDPAKLKDTYKEKILRVIESRRDGGAQHAERVAQTGGGRGHDGRATPKPRCGSKAGPERGGNAIGREKKQQAWKVRLRSSFIGV